MDTRQVQETLLALSANYREALSADQAALWNAQLVSLDGGWAAAAAQRLMQRSKWFPTLSEFLDAYDSERARAQQVERELGAQLRCTGCFDQDQAGWVLVDSSGHGTVKRCAVCNPSKPAGEHARDCSCMSCHYGPAEAAAIRSGFSPKERTGPPVDRSEAFAALKDSLRRG